MLTKENSNELVLFLEKYLDFYKEFFDAESQKYEAIVQNDIKTLDGFVKKEQALLLKSRGMEAARERLNVTLFNQNDITLRETVPLADEECQPKLKEIYDKLSDTLLDLKQMNSRSNTLAELRLHRIDMNIKQLETHPDLQTEYNSLAQSGSKARSVISKKV